MYILHTVLSTFPKVLIRRICLAIISFCGCWLFPKYSCDLIVIQQYYCKEKLAAAGREILPNAGANATKFFTLATKSWKIVAKPYLEI